MAALGVTRVLKLIGISDHIERPYKETVELGDSSQVVDAPVLGSYDILVSDGDAEYRFWAEVRKSPNAEAQIDWADELQDLLTRENAEKKAWEILSLAIFGHHSGNTLIESILLTNDT